MCAFVVWSSSIAAVDLFSSKEMHFSVTISRRQAGRKMTPPGCTHAHTDGGQVENITPLAQEAYKSTKGNLENSSA